MHICLAKGDKLFPVADQKKRKNHRAKKSGQVRQNKTAPHPSARSATDFFMESLKTKSGGKRISWWGWILIKRIPQVGL